MSRKSSINKIKRDNSKSKNIAGSLLMYLYEKQHSPVTTSFTGCGLAECDVLSISKSDYIYEYEIKISRSDYKRDFIKPKHSNIINEKYTKTIKKELNYLSANYFTYVVPTGLISIEEVPVYAGLIYFNEDLTFDVIKKPVLIHKTKATEKFIRKVAHNLSCKLIFSKINI
jgi:hypothetical protein